MDNSPGAHLKFTVKYRVSDAAAWQWLYGNSSSGVQEGEILLQEPPAQNPQIGSLLKLDEGWKAEAFATNIKGATLFSLQTSPLDPTKELERKTLGSVHGFVRYVAFSRIEPPWIGPRHGGDFLYLSEPTMLCSLLRKDGSVVTIAAPSPDDIYAVLETDEQGGLVVAAKADRSTGSPLRVLLSVGGDIETSIEAIMVQLRVEAGGSRLVHDMIKDDDKSTDSSAPHLEGLLDGLGFCTWNALGNELDRNKILGALRALRENNVKVSTLIIDDGWQDTGPTELDYSNPAWRGLAHFKAPAERLPHGLDELVRGVKSENPEIGEIGVWHALLGYWGAIAKQGYIVDNYETWDVDGKMYYAEPAKLKVVSPKDVVRFYDDFYAYLSKSGITFVKTDVQSLVSELTEGPVRTDLIPSYQAAWTAAYQKRLGGRAISCMSQVPEMLWRILLQDKTPPVIVRNSDDFFPEIPGSHSWHLWANAHNALFTQHLNAILDWDMFQTSHKYGVLHGAARCLSGGPILLTDIPGEHDMGLIQQMVAQTPDGRSIALRPTLMAKVSHAFDRIESRILKIANEASTGAKLLGVFNVGETDLSMFVSAAEFVAIGRSHWKQATEAIFLSHQTQKLFGPIGLTNTSPLASSPDALIQVDLKARGCDILSGFQVTRRTGAKGEMLIGVLGLMGKMTGAAAVVSQEISTVDGGKVSISLKLKALGDLGIWIQGAELEQGSVEAAVGGQDLGGEDLQVKSVPEGESAQLLTLDMIKAWSRRASGAKESGQVTVEVVISI